MTEVRPIYRDEAEPFLKLLCEVFELDFSRARTVFFNEPLFDLQRKWALVEEGHLVSILTTVPLQFGWGSAIGIAGVATRPDAQGLGYARRLLRHVLEDALGRGEKGALLFARDRRVYEKAGFDTLDSVVRGTIRGVEEPNTPLLPFDDVRAAYDGWASSHPDRLRRDDRRWNYWKWTLRVCTKLEEGYACLEGGMMRECVVCRPPGEWPIGKNLEWFGLKSLAASLDMPLDDPRHDLYLMGWGIESTPQLFMTDQF